VHHKSGDSYSVDPDLEKRLKAVGFRWVCVNHSGETRVTIYAMKRPLDTVAHKTSRRTQTYPVIIEHLVSCSVVERKEHGYPSRCLVSVLDLLRSLAEFQKEEYAEVCKRESFSHHLACIKRVS
jgi:hypothetical protein